MCTPATKCASSRQEIRAPVQEQEAKRSRDQERIVEVVVYKLGALKQIAFEL